jgi:hypothetical protein
MRNGSNGLGMLGAALLAGLIAIIANTLVLEAADLIPLVTARGGLLKLLKIYLSAPSPASASRTYGRRSHSPPLTAIPTRLASISSSGC